MPTTTAHQPWKPSTLLEICNQPVQLTIARMDMDRKAARRNHNDFAVSAAEQLINGVVLVDAIIRQSMAAARNAART